MLNNPILPTLKLFRHHQLNYKIDYRYYTILFRLYGIIGINKFHYITFIVKTHVLFVHGNIEHFSFVEDTSNNLYRF